MAFLYALKNSQRIWIWLFAFTYFAYVVESVANNEDATCHELKR